MSGIVGVTFTSASIRVELGLQNQALGRRIEQDTVHCLENGYKLVIERGSSMVAPATTGVAIRCAR
jgi:hypothetical protein